MRGATLGIYASAGIPSVYINSIQNVTLNLNSSGTSSTATISSVDTTKAFLLFQGWTQSGAQLSSNLTLPRIELTNATTVTVYRDSIDVNTITIQCQVIECTSSLVDSVQAGTVAISAATSGTATISSVTTSRSAVFFLGNTTTSTNVQQAANCSVVLTNATTVTANTNASLTCTVGFVVVQFKTGVTNSVQQISSTLTSANASDTATISSVNVNNTLLILNGNFTAQTDYDSAYRLILTNATTVTLTRTGTSATSRTTKFTVLEFAAGILNSNVQRGSIDLTSLTSNTATITSVKTDRSLYNFTGFNGRSASSNPSTSVQKIAQTNGTTVTATVNTSNATTKGSGYEVAELT